MTDLKTQVATYLLLADPLALDIVLAAAALAAALRETADDERPDDTSRERAPAEPA